MTADKARLESVELVPFRAGIKAGAESVMVAHVSIPAARRHARPASPEPAEARGRDRRERGSRDEGTMPASLSEPVVTGILRKELGFPGLVVTDAIRMGGITSHFTAGEAAVRAILAGADQILLSADTDAAIAAVRDAVKSGRIPKKRLDESVTRILDCKKKAEAERRSASPSWGASRRSSIRRPFGRSMPKSRGARSRSCASSPTLCRSGRVRNCFRSSSRTRRRRTAPPARSGQRSGRASRPPGP